MPTEHLGQDVCRHCGQGIAEHAMQDAYLPDLRRCPGFEAVESQPTSWGQS